MSSQIVFCEDECTLTCMETMLGGLLDDSSSDRATPKYEQLRAKLMSEVAAGRLRPGDMLPPEPVMAEQMNVARSTVRQALAQLEQSGIIRRIRGKGTFIHEDAQLRARSRPRRVCPDSAEHAKGVLPVSARWLRQRRGGRAQSDPGGQHAERFASPGGWDSPVDRQKSRRRRHCPGHVSRRRRPIRFASSSSIRSPSCFVIAVSKAFARRYWRLMEIMSGAWPAKRCSSTAIVMSLSSPPGAPNSRCSSKQVCAAAMQAGEARLADDCVVYVETDDDTNLKEYETRLEAAIDRLTGMKHRPTAIFSTFDDVAERIFLRLMRSGVSVPEDISLVSFGGARASARCNSN